MSETRKSNAACAWRYASGGGTRRAVVDCPACPCLQACPRDADIRLCVTICGCAPARSHAGPGRTRPHRSLIALGTIWTTVAIAGGSLGVAQSARAERTAALLTNRYLVLQPPVLAARAALANFQVLADRPSAAR
jgi:hypothetical protein